jgi:UDP-N-acetyl-D-glucosamine dehydrogenase
MIDVVVVGMGYVGLPVAISAAESNFNVIGCDLNEQKIKDLQSNKSFIPEVTNDQLKKLQLNKKIIFQNSLPQLYKSAIWIIAVPTPLNSMNQPDLSFLIQACQDISENIAEGSLVINESTSYIGTLRDLIKPTIDKISNLKNLKYAVAPERIDPGNSKWGLKNTPRVIAGIDNDSKQSAADFYSNFSGPIYQVTSPEIAEAAKLFENTFRQVNIALVNELAQIAAKYNLSTHEIINAASTKPFGFMPFYPSIGVGGHCIPVDPTYLSYSAEKVGIEAKFISLSNSVNQSAPRFTANRIVEFFNGDIAGKRIQIAGLAYKPNSSDTRESPAIELMVNLVSLGGIVTWCDPLVKSYKNQKSTNLSSNNDLGLIITPHDSFDFTVWKNNNLPVLDLSATSKSFGWPKFF